MYPDTLGEWQLTELDFARLSRLNPGDLPAQLAAKLGCAKVVTPREILPDVVTMYSQVEIVSMDSGRRQKLAVCYPRDAEPALGFVSVLSAVGSALLGLRVGDVVRWRVPDGGEHAAELAAILFQPEASGDYTT